MYIKKLTLSGFRNYSNAQLEFSPLTNVIYGNNAQGKTNILEAVYLFAQGRSHRTQTDKELVKFGEELAKLSIEFEDGERSHTAQIRILKNGKKSVSVNHVHLLKLSSLMNYLNVVMFSPEDLNLVKGSPNIRRRFMDSAVSQIYPAYLSALMEYKQALNQKNCLLKNLKYSGNNSDPTLSVWNRQLADSGVKIMQARIDFINRINKAAKHVQSEISAEELEIRYIPSIKCEEVSVSEMYEFLESRSAREIDAAASQYGIQRDDMEIFVNNREAKLFGSQGQQRTAALSMKIAQAEYIKDIKNEYPVLLLDDIMSELDISRRMYLSERIKDKQVLITSTDTDLIDKTTATRLFRIENGMVM